MIIQISLKITCSPFFKGILRGTDQTANVILEKCEERVFSSEGTEIVPLGLYIIRGDNV